VKSRKKAVAHTDGDHFAEARRFRPGTRLTEKVVPSLTVTNIDQPEHNLDNESVVKLLVDCIRQATARRQVIIVTHNPNLAVVCDAEQIICTFIDKADGNRFSYTSGAIEDYNINKLTVDILEGTYRAFDNRQKKYHRPDANTSRGIPILR